MQILVTGKGGKAGSWAVRGSQLGAAMGAEVQPMAEHSDCLSASIIVVVKRTPAALMRNVMHSKRPWVWDIVDAWPQPAGNAWSQDQALHWLRGEIERLKPTGIVFPTLRMQADSGFKGHSIVLPHHAWPKYQPVSVRQSVRVVGYEGDERYLGRWRGILQSECDRRDWILQVNQDMQNADIGVALRDTSGYPSAAWKSNCKLANIQALGIPAVLSPEAGYKETSNGTEYWIDHPAQIVHAFDELSDADTRSLIAQAQIHSAPQLKEIAGVYRVWLRNLLLML